LVKKRKKQKREIIMSEEKTEQLVMPGDTISYEEESLPSENTFVDNGEIKASIVGSTVISEGKASVHNKKYEAIKLGKGMLVVGSVVDDVGAVVFVRVDSIRTSNKKFLALKDGKIIAERRRDSNFRDGPEEPKPSKPCRVGDVVVARILDDSGDTYELSLDDSESGVVMSDCRSCGIPMQVDGKQEGTLVCQVCKRKENRRISIYYGKPEEILKIFEENRYYKLVERRRFMGGDRRGGGGFHDRRPFDRDRRGGFSRDRPGGDRDRGNFRDRREGRPPEQK
jgi:exosome complex component CSL4